MPNLDPETYSPLAAARPFFPNEKRNSRSRIAVPRMCLRLWVFLVSVWQPFAHVTNYALFSLSFVGNLLYALFSSCGPNLADSVRDKDALTCKISKYITVIYICKR